jgi:hypothetical protein
MGTSTLISLVEAQETEMGTAASIITTRIMLHCKAKIINILEFAL